MCGIVGILSKKLGEQLPIRVFKMTKALLHRGPDDEGIWVDDHSGIGVGLGHRRLSIIDVTAEGHQPMHSVSGRYVLIFNGEIYNFKQLIFELDRHKLAPRWRGHSDTEVLLACIEVWGVKVTLQKLVGMFAIALWDKSSGTLSLARDRLGEKPLYYGVVNGDFIFASELKAICAGSNSRLEISRASLAEFMRFGYVPAPMSIYAAVSKLLPGHLLVVNSAFNIIDASSFWALADPDQFSLREQLASCSDLELVDRTHNQLQNAVRLQMTSDVPIGAFLSGGVDSSTVVALMQSQSAQRIRTYTIGFEEESFNEAPYAKAVARHLDTDHTEMFVNAKLAADIIPELPLIYDEPFADSSQIPTALVSRLTRQHVTVSLSGDGGDELFAGYPRYQIIAALWKRVSSQPLALRKSASVMLRALSPQGWDRLLSVLPSTQRQRVNGRRIHRLSQLLTSDSLGEMYVRLMSQWQPEDSVVRGCDKQEVLSVPWVKNQDHIEAMRRWDVAQYLPDDLLVKVDRATMNASLESRAPLLDHRVVELAFALPHRVLVRDGVGKWILRQVLDRYVPRQLIERPKTGFSIPVAAWIRGPLRPWAESLLDPQELVNQGYLDARKVFEMWNQHIIGSHDRSLYLWNVLMFQAWLAAQKN